MHGQLTLSNYGSQNTEIDLEMLEYPRVKNKLAVCKKLSFEEI